MNKQIEQNSNNFLGKLRIFDGAQLKYIAMLSMLIDHVNKAIVYPYLNSGFLLYVSDIFDILGRIAYPLFIFLLWRAFSQTSSRMNYFQKICYYFAIITEIPF